LPAKPLEEKLTGVLKKKHFKVPIDASSPVKSVKSLYSKDFFFIFFVDKIRNLRTFVNRTIKYDGEKSANYH